MALANATLEAALVGYQVELRRISAAIAELEQRLGKKSTSRTQVRTKGAPARKRSRISAVGSLTKDARASQQHSANGGQQRRTKKRTRNFRIQFRRASAGAGFYSQAEQGGPQA
jgi:hypothetical protein